MWAKLPEYKTDREIAWRNLMVSAINAGIKAGVLTDDHEQDIDGKAVEFDIAGIGRAVVTFDSINFGVELPVDQNSVLSRGRPIFKSSRIDLEYVLRAQKRLRKS